MAVTAETDVYRVDEQPDVIIVTEQQQEVLARKQAERLFRIASAAGSLVLAETVEAVEADEPRFETLQDAIKAAANDDERARKMVRANVGTDVLERTIKAGLVMEVELEQGSSGGIVQFGQSHDEVLVNGLRFASGNRQMRGRSEAETRNGMRMGINLRMGNLEDHSFVVLSRPDDEMSKQELEKCGFFTETMSTAIQVLRVRDGRLIQESAFVAGVAKSGDKRYDAEAIVHVGQGLGVDLSGLSATEIIDKPLLIHNSLIPNGAVDLVKMYDGYAGTFFGQDQPAQDYQEYMEFCRQREQAMQPTVDGIVDELISEYATINTPTEATWRLHKLSEEHMVRYAVNDETINPHVFGGVAAGHIVEARFYRQRGEHEMADQLLQRAQETAVSSSCPFVSSGGEAGNGQAGSAQADVAANSAQAAAGTNSESKSWKTKKGRCVVKTCPTRKQVAKVEVGPCGVCMDRCQEMFDRGIDPTASLLVIEPRPRNVSDALPSNWLAEAFETASAKIVELPAKLAPEAAGPQAEKLVVAAAAA